MHHKDHFSSIFDLNIRIQFHNIILHTLEEIGKFNKNNLFQRSSHQNLFNHRVKNLMKLLLRYKKAAHETFILDIFIPFIAPNYL